MSYVNDNDLSEYNKLPSIVKAALERQAYPIDESRLVCGIILNTLSEAKGKTDTLQGEMNRHNARLWLKNNCGSFARYCDFIGVDFPYISMLVREELQKFDEWCVAHNKRRYL